MWKKCRQIFSDEELERMGERMAEIRSLAPTRSRRSRPPAQARSWPAGLSDRPASGSMIGSVKPNSAPPSGRSAAQMLAAHRLDQLARTRTGRCPRRRGSRARPLLR